MLDHKDSVYIRAIGFLYLRFTCPPEDLWAWFKDYVDDPTPIRLKFTKVPGGEGSTMGQFLRQLLKASEYSNTRLPRIPGVQVCLLFITDNNETLLVIFFFFLI